MILELSTVNNGNPRVPRVGGGDPKKVDKIYYIFMCSPRRRG